MNTKVYITIITITMLSASPVSLSQIIKENAIQSIDEFKGNQDPSKLSGSYSAIGRDKSLPEETRAELYVRILIRASEYLESHPKPARTPMLNVPPPDGGIPGEDPADIKDPIARAKYERDIAANKSLAEACTRHRILLDLQHSIMTYCMSFRRIKPENDKLLATYIQKQTTDPLAIKKVTDLINKEEANKTQQDNR